MKIVRNDQLATWTFVPVEEGEDQVLADIIAILKPEDMLSYGGRTRDDKEYKFCILYFHAGSEEKPDREVDGNVTICRTLHIGGVKLVLRGSSEEDKDENWSIRGCGNYSGGIIFLGETDVDGKKSIIVTGGRCKHCGAGLLDSEWNTCDACATKCEHVYTKGAIHGGGLNIGVGYSCDKCGRVKPKAEGEREKTPMEQFLAAEKDLGIVVFHRTRGEEYPLTSQQVIARERLSRRYLKSLRRRQVLAK